MDPKALVKEAARLQEKLEGLDVAVKDFETKKLNLEKDIQVLNSKKSDLEGQVKDLDRVINEHIEKATKEAKEKLAESNQLVSDQLATLSEKRSALDSEINKAKAKNVELDQIIRKNKEAGETTFRNMKEVEALRDKLSKIFNFIKENLL